MTPIEFAPQATAGASSVVRIDLEHSSTPSPETRRMAPRRSLAGTKAAAGSLRVSLRASRC
jgi:hypothetical protein